MRHRHPSSSIIPAASGRQEHKQPPPRLYDSPPRPAGGRCVPARRPGLTPPHRSPPQPSWSRGSRASTVTARDGPSRRRHPVTRLWLRLSWPPPGLRWVVVPGRARMGAAGSRSAEVGSAGVCASGYMPRSQEHWMDGIRDQKWFPAVGGRGVRFFGILEVER